MRPSYVAAIDQGTTSTRFLLFDREGRMVSLAQQLHSQYYPQPGWVEQDAQEIWQLVCRLVPQALADVDATSDQLVGRP